jgi:cysteinyl-tRNA synthetase
MHNGFIERGGEKMAKSVGNIDKVRDLLDEFPGEAIRLMLLKTHYRSPMEFTKEGLREARADLDYCYRALARISTVEPERGVEPAGALEGLQDDLNTSVALSSLHYNAGLALKEDDPAKQRAAKATMAALGGLLGLLRSAPDQWFRWKPKAAGILDEKEIAELIDLRLAARKAKNFGEADRIRDALAKQGVILEDGPKGTTWRRAG